eukprot:TRINITY_DN21590_c1_g2_i2.p1 TRINITY_DN21590_c1_g2~~TRINITY_DN21590_c1_g2_i2.p1  ORF type:complete len:313 (-),score=53.98 TRINITY_DN21590_c1_g2_i2:65-1003(-)
MMETSFNGFSSFGLKIKPFSVTPATQICAFSYQKFVSFALEETQRRTDLTPLPLQEQFRCLKAMDGKTELKTFSYRAPKIRLLRSLAIDGSQAMQVLDFAVFPEPEFDLPIFCANFVTAGSMNIIVLDLNPLHDVIIEMDYKEKYYKSLLPLGQKYAELLPWGGKITSESLRFFSPIVIWTRFTSSQNKHDVLYSAFMDYFKAWLEMMDLAVAESDESMVLRNHNAQHKYLTWRAEKDPGHQILKKLVGESLAKELVESFLFNGVRTLGSKAFLDYFPEYRCEDGKINKQRSIIGKSFEIRPWNARGEFIGG